MNNFRTLSLISAVVFAASFFIFPASQGSADILTGLAAYYKFDETSGAIASDSSGNGKTGTVNGASWTTGKLGGGLNFSGSDNDVAIPSANYAEFSVSAWFYKNSNDIYNADAIFGGWKYNADNQLQEGFDLRFFKTAPDTLQFKLVTKNASGVKTAGTASFDFGNSIGSWRHVVGTYNKTTGEQKLYVDGQLVNIQTHPAGNAVVPLTSYPDMRIGYSRANHGYFNGKIDEVRIYGRVLSPTEVIELYSATEATVAATVAAYSSSGGSNTLKVLPSNPRYFTDGSGKAIYLTGSHTWASLKEVGTANPDTAVFDYPGYLDFLKGHGHNFMRGWTWELSKYAYGGNVKYSFPFPWPRTGAGAALDGKPKFDLSKFDQSYFDQLRSRIIQARDRGIYVSIMFFEGHGINYSDSTWRWNGHPFNISNNINGIDGDPNKDGKGLESHTLQIPSIVTIEDNYVKKVIDTLNDMDNVVYEISNEDHSGSVDWQYHMINLVRDYEKTKPKQHVVGMTADRGLNSYVFNSTAEWVSPAGDGTSVDSPYKSNPPATDGSKVVVLDSDHLWGSGGDRVWVWKSFTRGYNPVYMDNLATDATKEGARKAMGHTLTYANKMNLAAMTPQNSLCSTTYCLVNAGSEYLTYQPSSGSSFTVNLLAGTYSYEWFNPAAGGVASTGSFTATAGNRTLTAPFSGDAVLYLKLSSTQSSSSSSSSQSSSSSSVSSSSSLSSSSSSQSSSSSSVLPPSSSTHIYIDPSSTDSIQDGSQAHPYHSWKNIPNNSPTRVATYYFKRGTRHIWPITIDNPNTTATNFITIDSYGKGSNRLNFSGSGWTNEGNGVYSRAVGSTAKNVHAFYINDIEQQEDYFYSYFVRKGYPNIIPKNGPRAGKWIYNSSNDKIYWNSNIGDPNGAASSQWGTMTDKPKLIGRIAITGAWKSEGNGIYSHSIAHSYPQVFFVGDPESSTDIKYDSGGSVPALGNWSHVGSVLYYRPSSGSAPAQSQYMVISSTEGLYMSGLRLQNGNYARVGNVAFTGAGRAGFEGFSSKNVILQNCLAYLNGHSYPEAHSAITIGIGGGIHFQGQNGSVSDCETYGNHDAGLELETASGTSYPLSVAYKDNWAHNNGEWGLSVHGNSGNPATVVADNIIVERSGDTSLVLYGVAKSAGYGPAGVGFEHGQGTFTNSVFDSNRGQGFDWPASFGNTTVRNSLFINNNIGNNSIGKGAETFYFQNTNAQTDLNIYLYNNTFYETSAENIFQKYSSGYFPHVEAKNNIFIAGSGKYNIEAQVNIGNNPSAIFDRNNFGKGTFSNKIAAAVISDINTWNSKTYVGTDSSFNPLFTNEAGKVLTLQSQSPLINAGVNTGLATDILGNSVVGNRDIGAFEYTTVTAGSSSSASSPQSSSSSLSSSQPSSSSSAVSSSSLSSSSSSAAAKFIAGDRVITTDNLNVRASAALTGTLLGIQPTGSLGTIVSGPVSSSGYNWYYVDYDNAPDGWSVENYLEKTTTPPASSSSSSLPSSSSVSSAVSSASSASSQSSSVQSSSSSAAASSSSSSVKFEKFTKGNRTDDTTTTTSSSSSSTSGPPGRIKNLRASSGSVILEWDAVSADDSAKKILIYRSVSGYPDGSDDSYLIATIGDTSQVSYRDTGVADGVTYYYSIFTESGNGLRSDAATISFHHKGSGKAAKIVSGPFSIGARSEQVKILQEMLASDKEIYPEGEITGFYGPATTEAVKKFQQKHGIEPTGLAGPLTRTKLNELSAKESKPSPLLPADYSSMSDQQKQELVKQLKEMLADLLARLSELLKQKIEKGQTSN